jgi:hypothetical protein
MGPFSLSVGSALSSQRFRHPRVTSRCLHQQAVAVITGFYDTTPDKSRYEARDDGATLSHAYLARGAGHGSV